MDARQFWWRALYPPPPLARFSHRAPSNSRPPPPEIPGALSYCSALRPYNTPSPCSYSPAAWASAAHASHSHRVREPASQGTTQGPLLTGAPCRLPVRQPKRGRPLRGPPGRGHRGHRGRQRPSECSGRGHRWAKRVTQGEALRHLLLSPCSLNCPELLYSAPPRNPSPSHPAPTGGVLPHRTPAAPAQPMLSCNFTKSGWRWSPGSRRGSSGPFCTTSLRAICRICTALWGTGRPSCYTS